LHILQLSVTICQIPIQAESIKRMIMKDQKAGATSIDEYIAGCPKDIQPALEALRKTIRAAAPEAEERISYLMPTFTLKGNLVHFALMKNHIGFYPTSSGVQAFAAELSPYECTPGAIRFPVGQSLPMDLITRIVEFRVRENLERDSAKAARNSQK
jgi:uncharacterized protein YdhG (YjbR/CyaY superfamily)